MPMLKPDNLTGTIAYTDGQFDDARYNLALIQTVSECGGELLNYARVLGFGRDGKGRLAEAQVRDEQTGRHFTLRARAFVNATGPFADHIRALATPRVAPRLRLSKGSHILLPLDAIGCNHALLVPKTDDGRVMFAIPWLDRLLVGTTDDETSLCGEMEVTEAEAEYLLRHLNRYLIRPLTLHEIVSGFAGLRPLLASGKARSTKDLARDHEIEVDHSSGLISVLGGKWTTYRAMAEDAIDVVQQYLGLSVSLCKTSHHVLSGSEGWEPSLWTILADYGISKGTARHLSEKFGNAAADVLSLTREDPQLKQPIVENGPAIRAEVTYSVRREMAMSIEDVLARRIGVQLFSWEDAIRCAPIVGSLLAREFSWPPARQKEEVGKYIRKIAYLMQEVGLRPLHTLVDADRQKKSNQMASDEQRA